jgi:hypothetical protein
MWCIVGCKQTPVQSCNRLSGTRVLSAILRIVGCVTQARSTDLSSPAGGLSRSRTAARFQSSPPATTQNRGVSQANPRQTSVGTSSAMTLVSNNPWSWLGFACEMNREMNYVSNNPRESLEFACETSSHRQLLEQQPRLNRHSVRRRQFPQVRLLRRRRRSIGDSVTDLPERSLVCTLSVYLTDRAECVCDGSSWVSLSVCVYI